MNLYVMRIPEGTIEEINQRINIVEVVQDFVTLEKRGNRYWGLCPFHTEKTPSMSVDPDKNLFYCFGCHKGGTMFTFLMEVEHIPFVEAAEKLAQRAGIEINSENRDPEAERGKRALSDLYARITSTFHYLLTEHEMGHKAKAYLAERGFGEASIERFQLGYAPEDRRWLYRFLRQKNYSEEFLAASGLFSKKYKDYSIFSGRVIFPIRSAGGDVVAFGGRNITGGEPKYINSPETELYQKRRILFGLNRAVKGIQRNRRVLIVEGYFDVLAFFEAELPFAVAPLGTALTEEQARVLRRYADRATLVFDDDRAGIQAARRGIEVMEKVGMQCDVVVPHGGKDPADILLNEGSNSLLNMLKSPTNGFQFLMRKAAEQHGTGGAEQKSQVVAELAPYIQSIDSEVKREDIIKYLADFLQVGPRAVLHDINAIKQGKQPRTEGQQAVTKEKKRVGTDLFLMLAVVVNCSYFREVRRNIGLEDLEDSDARELYIALEEAYRSDELDIDHVIPRIESERVQHLVFEKSATGEFEENADAIIEDGIKNIKVRSLQAKRRTLLDQIKSVERSGSDYGVLKELLSEKMFLDEELKRIKGDAQ
ncbi:MAG: DNA primase [Spirochaetota bacterium]